MKTPTSHAARAGQGRTTVQHGVRAPHVSFAGTAIERAARYRGWQALAARAIDTLAAGFGLVLLAAPMVLLALLIKLTSRGPVMYRQERVGLRGQTFTMYKFRTMDPDAEQGTGPVWAHKNDPRRTRVGVYLRRYSLDELPQLVNVLRGEMSLVGPRPERPCFVHKFALEFPGYMRRHGVRPGITGWAQINGLRGDTSLEHRLKYDLQYIDQWSLAFNLRILLLTPIKVLIEKNAY